MAPVVTPWAAINPARPPSIASSIAAQVVQRESFIRSVFPRRVCWRHGASPILPHGFGSERVGRPKRIASCCWVWVHGFVTHVSPTKQTMWQTPELALERRGEMYGAHQRLASFFPRREDGFTSGISYPIMGDPRTPPLYESPEVSGEFPERVSQSDPIKNGLSLLFRAGPPERIASVDVPRFRQPPRGCETQYGASRSAHAARAIY